ncbi:hypothetical protein EBS80_02460 [bacterium]|nr:hypothetical protein [bacterium]
MEEHEGGPQVARADRRRPRARAQGLAAHADEGGTRSGRGCRRAGRQGGRFHEHEEGGRPGGRRTIPEPRGLHDGGLLHSGLQGAGVRGKPDIKELLKKNIGGEKEQEEKGRQEREMLEAIAKESRFDDIPDLLLNEEINKMIHELERGAEEQGMQFDDYLKSIKKTVAELKMEFAQQAMMRIKVALILRDIVKDEKIEVTDAEVEDSLDKIAEKYEGKEDRDRIYNPEYRGYVEYTLKNRKALEALRTAMVK